MKATSLNGGTDKRCQCSNNQIFWHCFHNASEADAVKRKIEKKTRDSSSRSASRRREQTDPRMGFLITSPLAFAIESRYVALQSSHDKFGPIESMLVFEKCITEVSPRDSLILSLSLLIRDVFCIFERININDASSLPVKHSLADASFVTHYLPSSRVDDQAGHDLPHKVSLVNGHYGLVLEMGADEKYRGQTLYLTTDIALRMRDKILKRLADFAGDLNQESIRELSCDSATQCRCVVKLLIDLLVGHTPSASSLMLARTLPLVEGNNSKTRTLISPSMKIRVTLNSMLDDPARMVQAIPFFIEEYEKLELPKKDTSLSHAFDLHNAVSGTVDAWAKASASDLRNVRNVLAKAFRMRAYRDLLSLDPNSPTAEIVEEINLYFKTRAVAEASELVDHNLELSGLEKEQLSLIVKDLRKGGGASLLFQAKGMRKPVECTLTVSLPTAKKKMEIKIRTQGTPQKNLWARSYLPPKLRFKLD